MATFSDYNEIIELKLANTSEVFFDENMKRQEINNTVQELISEYALPEFKKKGTITFDVLGKADKPTDFQRMIKLWDINALGVQTKEYNYIVEDEFDKLGDTAGNVYTEDFDTTTRIFKVKPIDSGTLQIRYYRTATKLTSAVTETDLNDLWNECVALGTTSRLLKNAGRYDEAGVFQQEYIDKKMETYLRVDTEGGVKRNNRFKSKYERISQF